MNCPFCQNYEIAGAGEDFPAESVTPRRLAELAGELKTRGNIGIAYTYNEPLVGWEFVRDCANEVRARGMKNILVHERHRRAGDSARAAAAYRRVQHRPQGLHGRMVQKARRRPRNGEAVHRRGRRRGARGADDADSPPGENDGEDEMRALSSWIASLDRRIPLHVTRFFPRRLMTGRPPTPKETLFPPRGNCAREARNCNSRKRVENIKTRRKSVPRVFLRNAGPSP